MNKNGTQRLETERLILRRYVIEDAEDMFRNWASDPEVTKFLTWPTHKSVEITRMVLNDWLSQYADGGYFNWAMEYKENGQHQAGERRQVIPLQGLALEDEQHDDGKDRQGDDFLNDFELHEIERSAGAGKPDAVGRHGKAILEKSDAP